jgi:predicted naringenin-chalcone synthase
MADDKKKTTEKTAEQKRETWLNWLAITTILFSAAATLATFRGGGLSTRAVLTQSNASDNWSYYQAKSVKQHTYEIQREMFQIQTLAAPEAQAAAYKKTIAKYEDKVNQYKKEKTAILNEARTLEAERSRCQDIGGCFGLAVPYLQVAIMLSALAALMKKKPLWAVGCIPGVVGLGYFIAGYLLYLTLEPMVNLMVLRP